MAEYDLKPYLGSKLEDSVEQTTPATFREYVRCTYLTADSNGTIKGQLVEQYREEEANPLHNDGPFSMGPPTVVVWRLRITYTWESFYANAMSTDVHVQVGGNSPVVNVNTIYNQQKIANLLRGEAPRIEDYVSTSGHPQGGGISYEPIDFLPPKKSFVVVRFENHTSRAVTVKFRWTAESQWQSQVLPTGTRWMWWHEADGSYWQPKCTINDAQELLQFTPIMQPIMTYQLPRWDDTGYSGVFCVTIIDDTPTNSLAAENFTIGSTSDSAGLPLKEFVVARFQNQTNVSVEFRMRWTGALQWLSKSLQPGAKWMSWHKSDSVFWQQFQEVQTQCRIGEYFHTVQVNIVKAMAAPSWSTISSVSGTIKITKIARIDGVIRFVDSAIG